jgi:hypothetical protein
MDYEMIAFTDNQKHGALLAARILFTHSGYRQFGEWEKCCLLASVCLISILDEIDPENAHLLQAGTASFRAVPKHLDDGVSPTHFSYEFHQDAVMQQVAQCGFPEMHCWVVRRPRDNDFPVSEMELIDPLYHYQYERAREIQPNIIWDDSLKPTKPLWEKVSLLPDTVHYEAIVEAIAIAITLLKQLPLRRVQPVQQP